MGRLGRSARRKGQIDSGQWDEVTDTESKICTYMDELVCDGQSIHII